MSTKPPNVPPRLVVKAAQAAQAGLHLLAQKMSPPFVQVLDLALGAMKARILYAAAKLDLAGLLRDGPRGADDLARETGMNPDALYRAMRAMAALGILTEVDPRMFDTTAVGKTLDDEHPTSMRPVALLIGSQGWNGAWEDLLYSLETGEPSLAHRFGKPILEYLQEHPDEWSLFDRWMTRVAQLNCPAIAASFPFGKFKHVVDVGGGQGALISHILLRHGHVKGTLFDLPEVVSNPVGIDASVHERCEVVAGDFFESVPGGADIYIMQQIIHDWDDDRCKKILSLCRDALAPGGRVLIVDAVIEAGDAFDPAKLIDLHMLLLSGGRERTETQFRALLAQSGLALVKVHPTAAMFSIIEARVA